MDRGPHLQIKKKINNTILKLAKFMGRYFTENEIQILGFSKKYNHLHIKEKYIMKRLLRSPCSRRRQAKVMKWEDPGWTTENCSHSAGGV